MSKRSKERRRLRESTLANNQPVTGTFEQRAAAIVAAENNGNKVGHAVVADNRLPEYYSNQLGYNYLHPNKYLDNEHNKPTIDVGYKPITYQADKTTFKVASQDILKECPIAKVPKVYVPARLWNEWISLAEDYDVEWLAYLVGRFIEDDDGARYEVSKMYFPPQTATGAHVDVDDDFSTYLPNTIGAVHSHVKMGVFFSGEDMAHSNWPVEIVINANNEGKVMVRQQLACGQWSKNYSTILTTGDNASSNYVSALDKAFESGQKLREVRSATKAASVGYRTPDITKKEPLQPVNKISANPKDEKDWPFHINGKPHRWNETKQCYEEVYKVGDEWLSEDQINIRTMPDNKISDHMPDGTGDSDGWNTCGWNTWPILTDTKASMDIVDATISIDEATGQILIDGEPSQAEIDAGMEAMIDADNCQDCDGEGKLDANGTLIECTGCGGSGKKVEKWHDQWKGYAY